MLFGGSLRPRRYPQDPTVAYTRSISSSSNEFAKIRARTAATGSPPQASMAWPTAASSSAAVASWSAAVGDLGCIGDLGWLHMSERLPVRWTPTLGVCEARGWGSTATDWRAFETGFNSKAQEVAARCHKGFLCFSDKLSRTFQFNVVGLPCSPSKWLMTTGIGPPDD